MLKLMSILCVCVCVRIWVNERQENVDLRCCVYQWHISKSLLHLVFTQSSWRWLIVLFITKDFSYCDTGSGLLRCAADCFHHIINCKKCQKKNEFSLLFWVKRMTQVAVYFVTFKCEFTRNVTVQLRKSSTSSFKLWLTVTSFLLSYVVMIIVIIIIIIKPNFQ